MRWILYLFSLIILSVIVCIGALFFLGLQSEALVHSGESLSREQSANIQRFIQDNDPRELEEGEKKHLQISAEQANLITDYFESIYSDYRAQVAFFSGWARLQATLLLPVAIPNRYLNIQAEFSSYDQNLIIDKIKVGSLPVPGFLADGLKQLAHNFLMRYPEYNKATRSVNSFAFEQNLLSMAYHWQPELVEDLKARTQNFMFDEEERKRIRAYQHHLSKLSHQLPVDKIEMLNLLQPMFQYADERVSKGENAVEENRALLLVMGLYAMKKDIGEVLGNRVGDSMPANYMGMRLRQRTDLSQHFLVSAAISVNAGSAVADTIGLWKEISDSDGGSGFSFADLAADRAGVRFAEVATASDRSARFLIDFLAKAPTEADLMPPIDHLPEQIMQLEFNRRFRDLDSANYDLVNNEVERRVATCLLYQ